MLHIAIGTFLEIYFLHVFNHLSKSDPLPPIDNFFHRRFMFISPLNADEHVRYEGGLSITTNALRSAFSLFPRGVVGAWHEVSMKHLPAYLQEMTWRFNNCKNQYLFRDTLMRRLASGNRIQGESRRLPKGTPPVSNLCLGASE